MVPLPLRRAALFLAALAWGSGAALAQPVTQPFTFDLVPHTLPQTRHGALAWGDFDGDGDLDAALSGLTDGGLVAAVYRNDGKADASEDAMVVFTDVDAGLPPVAYGRLAWADYDNDGDLDLLLTGSRTEEPPYEPVTMLLRNDTGSESGTGDGRFTDAGASLEALHSGPAAWGDYDNDGDADLLLAGVNASGERRTLLYRNDGGGRFTDAGANLRGSAFGDAAWGDYDNDGDRDLALSGVSDEAGFGAAVYRNDGGGRFTDLGADLGADAFGTTAWGDFDGDGDLDLVLSGGTLTLGFFDTTTRLYENRNGTFVDAEAGLPGLIAGTAAWGDYDDDGDRDLLLTGAETPEGRRTARLLRNDGDGVFVTSTFLIGTMFGASDWGDFDGDGDLDLLTSGLSFSGPSVTNLYENRRQVIPPPPPAPQALTAAVAGGTVTLAWNAPVETTGPTYNLRVGRTPGGGEVVAAAADPATGRLRLARAGNVFHNTAWTLRDLPNGTYHWSVQAIDAGFHASPFAAEGVFTVTDAVHVDAETPDELPARVTLHPAFPNPFRETTTLRFELPRPERVTVIVYDVLGARVATLFDGPADAGAHEALWDGRDAAGRPAAAGAYLVVLRAGARTHTAAVLRIR